MTPQTNPCQGKVNTEFPLRDYQSSAIESLRQGIRTGHRRQILQASTGAGKTVMAASMIRNAEAKGNRTLFIADSLELVEQAVTTFDRFGLEVGVMQSNHYRTDESCLTQVCTPQTLAGRLRRQRDKFERYPVSLIVHDECHVQYKARETLSELYPNAPVIGLTATPFSKGLGKFYSNVVSAVPMQQLIDEGHLSDFVVYGPSKPDMRGVSRDAKGDFAAGEIGERYTPKLTADIVQTWLDHGRGRPTLGFCATVGESRKMAEEFKAIGVRAAHIDGYGSTKEEKQQRRDVIAQYNAGDLDMLWNCLILTKGFDSPHTSCLIIARPTQSMSVHFQIIGRGLRTHPGKDKCVILDHAGNFDRLIFPTQCTDFDLDDGTPKAAEERLVLDKPAPCKCHACGYTQQTFFRQCPGCGSEKTRQIDLKDVLIEEGVLVEKKPEPKITTEEKREFFGGLLHIAREKGHKDGWAYHKFTRKYGHTPKGYAKQTCLPNSDVTGFIRHLNIAYAKSKQANGVQA